MVGTLITASALLGLGTTPASSGQLPPPPTVDGTTITGTYTAYQGKPFFEGGYRFPKKLLSNVVRITCSSGGESKPTSGPDHSPECGFHPAQKVATVTIEGRVPWFELDPSFSLTPYWSYNDRDYRFGRKITLRASGSSSSNALTKAAAAQSYLTATAPVNNAVNAFNLRVAAYDQATTPTQVASDAQPLATALDDIQPKLITISRDFPPAAPALKLQVKAVKVIVIDIRQLSKRNKILTVAKWKKKFKIHLVNLIKTSTNVRSDLGLPPPSALRK